MSTPRPFSNTRAISGIAEIFDQDELRELPVDSIDPDPAQPRKTWDTEEAQAEYVATRESIRAEGVRNPISVRNSEDGRFMLISGETRLRGCKELGLRTIPGIVRQQIDMRQVRMDQLVENVRRNGLNPVDLARALQERLDEGVRRDALMASLGVTEQWLSKRLSILKFADEVQDLARTGRVRDIDTLSALDQMDTEERAMQLRALEEGAFNGAAVRATVKVSKKRKKKRRAPPGDPNTRALVSKMQEHFGAKVRLEHNQKTGKGSVTFEFFSLEELEGLLEKWHFKHQESTGD